ncbi:MAG: hypothetical protein AAF430_01575 [Myxococcota bacterium]
MSAFFPDTAALEKTQATAASPPNTSPPEPKETPARFTEASRMLRAAGSVALVAALSTFLWQHWEAGSDLTRAGTLLAHTVGLTLAGLFCGLRARDGKAARTFLGLAGASLPIVACVGGGLVYSQLGPEPVAGLADYATWVAPSLATALLAGAGAFVVTIPVAALAMGAFGRRCLVPLTAAAVAGNALLLLPTRDADAIAVLAGLALVGLGALEWRVLRREPSLANLEGGIARALVTAPLLVLVGRHILHYEASALFLAVGWFSVALGLTAVSWVSRLPEQARNVARWSAVVPAGWAAAAFADALGGAGLAQGFLVPMAAAGFAAQLALASFFAGDEPWGASFRRVGVLAFAGACVLNLALVPGLVASLLAGIAGIGLLGWGTLRDQRPLQWIGAASALAAVAVHVQHAIALYAWSRWGSLALLGVLVILAASWVERAGPVALRRIEIWKRRLAART